MEIHAASNDFLRGRGTVRETGNRVDPRYFPESRFDPSTCQLARRSNERLSCLVLHAAGSFANDDNIRWNRATERYRATYAVHKTTTTTTKHHSTYTKNIAHPFPLQSMSVVPNDFTSSAARPLPTPLTSIKSSSPTAQVKGTRPKWSKIAAATSGPIPLNDCSR